MRERPAARFPLAGLRILDFTHWIAGPYCTKLLADFGADVIKIERLEGDPCRRLGPFMNDEPSLEGSALFAFLNTNKKGATLNLKSPFAKRTVAAIARDVDVVVENFRPGVMERLGFSYNDLKEINPRLVMTSISNFGQTGPYRDWMASEITLYAMGGAMNVTGEPERPPVKLAESIVQFHGGNAAAAATLTASFVAKLRGFGQHADVSLFETQMGNIDRRSPYLVTYQYTGQAARREPAASGSFPNGIYPCKDGYFYVTGGVQFFDRVCAMMDMPELAKDPKYQGAAALTDPQRREEFEVVFLNWLVDRDRAEATAAGQRARVPCAPVAAPTEVLENEHLRARNAFVPAEREPFPAMRMPGPPFRMSGGSWRSGPAPRLGQHNHEIYGQYLGLSVDEVDRARSLGYV